MLITVSIKSFLLLALNIWSHLMLLFRVISGSVEEHFFLDRVLFKFLRYQFSPSMVHAGINSDRNARRHRWHGMDSQIWRPIEFLLPFFVVASI